MYGWPWCRCWDSTCGIDRPTGACCSWVAVKPWILFAPSGDRDILSWKLLPRGFQASRIGCVVVRKCVEIIRDSGQRVSCGGSGHTQLAHMSALNQRRKKKKEREREQHGWHQLWTEQFNRSVERRRNPEKPLKSSAGGLDCCVCVAGWVFVQCVWPLGDLFVLWEKLLTTLFRHWEIWGLLGPTFTQVDPAIAKCVTKVMHYAEGSDASEFLMHCHEQVWSALSSNPAESHYGPSRWKKTKQAKK